MIAMVDFLDELISYKEFYEKYIMENKPCLLSKKFTENWKCRSTWVNNDGSVNTEHFRRMCADIDVPVVNCSKKYFSSHEKTDMCLSKFLDYWEEREGKLLYLKDWHLQRSCQGFYNVPMYFTSDWLNEYFDSLGTDDYRFVYIGVKGTWTPFHADVFKSFSWSANICGVKKWIFYPPGEEDPLKDQFGNLPFDILKLVSSKHDKGIEVIQKAGEVLFVPSCWHHQVFNLEDTISINHNWINAGNVKVMYKHICQQLDDVKKEIKDCQSMDGYLEQCQLILKASCGIDLKGFFHMLVYLLEKRLKVSNFLNGINKTDTCELMEKLATIFIGSSPGKSNYCENIPVADKTEFLKYDIKKLEETLHLLLSHEDLRTVITEEMFDTGTKLLHICKDMQE